eukprot:gene5574-5811_t
MASIKIGSAAMAAILDALMANDRKGLRNLMLGLADSAGCKTAGSLSAIGMATVSFLAGAVQALAGLPASVIAADALVDTLLGDEQQVLHHIMQFPKLTLNITFIVRVTAQAAPARLLQALLKRKERRSLHLLISMLGGEDNSMVADTVNAVTRMAQLADVKQLRALLRLLLPAMQAGNVGSAHCVAFMAQLPLAVPELLHSVRQFQALMQQRGHRCDVLATSVLWHLAHHPLGLQALSTQRRLDSFVQVLGQNECEVAQAAASIVYLSSQTPKGNDILRQHLPALLQAARVPQGSIASSAMASVAMIASRSLGGAQQVLQYTDQVLDVMLQPLTAEFAASPGNAAQQAGFTLFYIWQCPKGPEVLSSDSNLDKLLQVVQQQGPAMPDAANALRQLLNVMPQSRRVVITPARAAMLDSVQGILEGALLADSEQLSGDRGYQCLAPVFYMTMVAGSFGYCPSYLQHLVRVMQRTEVTVPVLEIMSHVASGPEGLLAVAPHMQQVLAATTAGLLAEDPFLQEYVQTLVRRIKAEVEQLRQQQQAAQRGMHRAGVCLTQQWQHLRRRDNLSPGIPPLQQLVQEQHHGAGDYKFEQAMLNVTPCEIHTFDCTYNGSSQHPSRHFYHNWCVGPERNPKYRNWSNITQTLRHASVDVVKVQIESFEYSFLSELTLGDPSLPVQLATEFHVGPGAERWAKTDYPVTAAEIALVFKHLANLGYASYSQEVNNYAPDCCADSSFILLRMN